jgi:general secretion pathway protein L
MTDVTLTGNPTVRRVFNAFNGALAWWLIELGEILGLLTRFNKPNLVEFEVTGDEPVLLHGEKARYAGARRQVSLRLDDNAFLFRRIKLPAAARKNIDRVVGYEFNKYFPMDAKDALFSCKIAPPVAGAASIEIEIWAISKTLIDLYLSMIRQQYELQIRRLLIANHEGQVLITRDIEKEQRLEAGDTRAFPGRALNLAIAGLLLALVVYPVKRIDAYLEQQQLEIARLEKQAQPIIELRQKTTALNDRFYQLADRQKEAPNQVSIWSHLTKSMATQAIFDRLEIDGRNVRVTGKATSVEGLLRSLESDQRIVEVKINGPVKATGDGQYESMSLTLTVKERAR